MAAKTPSGWRMYSQSIPAATSSSALPIINVGIPHACSTFSMPRRTDPRASSSVLPFSRVTVAARRLSTHELGLLGRPCEGDRRAAAAVHDLRDLVEVADPHELLMLHGLVAIVLSREFPRLQLGVCRHAARAVVLRQREHAVVQRVEAGEGDELELVAHRAKLLLEAGELRSIEMALPVERRRAVVREQLARILLVDGFGELARFSEIRFRRLEPEHVGVRRIGARSRDRRLDAVTDHKEPFGRALPRTPAAIVFVAV